MEIDPATQGDAGIYECHANNKYLILKYIYLNFILNCISISIK